MADFPLAWDAGQSMNPGGPAGIVTSGYTGAEEGYKLGQQHAMVHALQGIDLSSPPSVDAGIGALVRANAGEQASALQNLAFTRTMRQQIPAWMAAITSAMKGDQEAAPAAAPQGGSDPKHAIETMTMAKDAADKLLTTPEADRPAAFAKIKQDMMSRGIPEAAIDSAGGDLSDVGLKSLSDHYGEVIAHGEHALNPQGEAPPIPQRHPSNAWYDRLANNPDAAMAIAGMKAAGWDITPVLDTAVKLATPSIEEAAKAAYAGPIAQATSTAQKGVEIAAAPVLGAIQAWTAGKIKDAELPAAIRKAQAEADIAAQHDITQVDEVDSQGQPTGRQVQVRKDAALNAGGAGKPVGRSQSPGEKSGQTQDAGLFMERYKAEANQDAIRADINARDLATAGAKLAQTLNPSNLTPWIARNANTLQGLGFKIAAKDANNLAAYQQIVAQNVKNATTIFPRLANEFHAVQEASASAKTPGDAAALALTQTAAVRDMAAQQKQFRVQWAAEHPGQYSERAFQTAWAQQPGANQSLFASPLFRELKFNGKPAVTVAPPFTAGPHAGQVWGVFMPGTPQKTAFRVK